MKKIDWHAHYISPGYNDYLDECFKGKGDGISTPTFSLDAYLELTRALDIEFGVLSISSPHISAALDEDILPLTEEVNQYGAQIVAEHPDKLGFLATLPLPFVEESIEIIDHALDKHNALGFTLPTNARGIYLGEPVIDDVLAKLNARHAIVAIHPNEPKPSVAVMKDVILPPLMEFIFDTTRTIIYMSQQNVFSKYPHIQWIVPHGGAVLPIIAQRVKIGNETFNHSNNTDDLEQVMKHLHFDLAGIVIPYQLANLLPWADENKIIYGSDSPYTPHKAVHVLSEQLEENDIVSSSTLEAMLYQNGKDLLNKYKK